MKMPLCKDCIWVRSLKKTPSCTSPFLTRDDLVNGGVYYKSCQELRDNESRCGSIGRFFEAKKKK